jgi:NADPH:quinone reductase-like Zn-dependent oxidoreductase
VLEATGGRGVDVALNSLAGELLHTTWKCIAPFGTMIGMENYHLQKKSLAYHLEFGKRDLYGHAKLDMKNFTENRTFVTIDSRHMRAERPELCGR